MNIKEKMTLDLCGNWRFRMKGRNGLAESDIPAGLDEWMAAEVPGTVHTDLMAQDMISDPFFGDNETRVQWVGEADWEYSRTFHADEVLLSHREIDLLCDGLDTLATVYINGQAVYSSKNMFIGHRIPVKEFLTLGENTVSIRFESPLVYCRDMERRFGRLTDTRHSHRMYLRKAQYSFGWDWGPMLPTSGIWRGIHLEAFNRVRIEDLTVRTISCTSEVAYLEVDALLSGLSDQELRGTIHLDGGGEIISHEAIAENGRMHMTLTVANPHLWWPLGYGDPHLYDVHFTLSSHGDIIDEKNFKFGIRTTHLQQKDQEGRECFHIMVNGEPVFCRGCDWIPADSFIPRVSQDKYRRLLEMTRDAGMNMLRIWGGGIYEDPYFYELCDEMGIMVWQDFMFACGAYPDQKDFIVEVKKEAEWVIRALRNHPSIVLWCGNNENEWIFHRDGNGPPQKMHGFNLFHTLLPGICDNMDPTRPYWPSTPWGGDDPNSQETGNRHSWDIWSRWVDFTEVKHDEGLFISEFGFQAPAAIETMNGCLAPEDRNPEGEVFLCHQKQDEGNERLFRFLAGHQKVTTEYEPFIYACQVNQAEALKTCIEHWRSRKFRTAGALIWQLNDCWPVVSWALIDGDLQPKAAYYYSRKFFNPQLLGFRETDSGLNLYWVNDTLKALNGEITASIKSFDGEGLAQRKIPVAVSSNSVTEMEFFSNDHLAALNKKRVFVNAILKVNDVETVRTNHVFLRYKWMDFPAGEIRADIIHQSTEGVTIQCKSNVFLKSVCFHLPGWCFSDNFFDLEAGRPLEITAVKEDERAGDLSEIEYYSVGYYTPRNVYLDTGDMSGGST